MTCSAIRDSFSKQYGETGVFACPGKRGSRMSEKKAAETAACHDTRNGCLPFCHRRDVDLAL
jgi:hypothetical protein